MSDQRKDADLIEAVETGSLALVKKALAESADPNARKRITLTVTLDKNRSGQTKTDTVLAESVIAIAVIHASPEIVETLLQAGADASRPVEWSRTWAPSQYWSGGNWSGRWQAIRTFRSALALALTNGTLLMNKKGGHVRIDTPLADSDAFVRVTHQPRLDVVAVLLRYAPGAIDADLFSNAKALGDNRFAALIEKRLEQEYETAVTTVATSRGNAEDFKSQVEALATQVEQLTTRFLADTDRLQQRVKDLEGRNAELVRRVESTSQQTARIDQATVQLSSKLDQTSAHLSTKIEQATSQFGQSATQTSTRLARLEQQVAALQAHQPSSHAHTPPIDVKRLMHVVANFVPYDTDEIALSVGQMVFCNLEYHDGWGSGLNTSTGLSGHFPMVCISDSTTTIQSPVSISARTSSIIPSMRMAPPPPSVARDVPSTRVFGDVRGPGA
ncbi:hypothetical protein HDU93_001662 [Gonapodya sp. JEL0774]|nr:hypothetical protein HDU93_001662 [Gonapodya sp. JEL0774]